MIAVTAVGEPTSWNGARLRPCPGLKLTIDNPEPGLVISWGRLPTPFSVNSGAEALGSHWSSWLIGIVVVTGPCRACEVARPVIAKEADRLAAAFDCGPPTNCGSV